MEFMNKKDRVKASKKEVGLDVFIVLFIWFPMNIEKI